MYSCVTVLNPLYTIKQIQLSLVEVYNIEHVILTFLGTVQSPNRRSAGHCVPRAGGWALLHKALKFNFILSKEPNSLVWKMYNCHFLAVYSKQFTLYQISYGHVVTNNQYPSLNLIAPISTPIYSRMIKNQAKYSEIVPNFLTNRKKIAVSAARVFLKLFTFKNFVHFWQY